MNSSTAKLVVITGGVRGIGESITKKFLSMGWKVIATRCNRIDKDFRNTFEVSEEHKKSLKIVELDLASASSIEKFINYIESCDERINCFVSNAGMCRFEEFLDIETESLNETMMVNFSGPFIITQAICRHMISNFVEGSLVYVSSISADYGGTLQAHYCSSKGAVDQLMRSVAVAMGKHGIRANSVQPGTVLTDINIKELTRDKSLLEYFINRSPLNRLPEKEDIANCVYFLATNEANSINGTCLRVDCGMTQSLQ